MENNLAQIWKDISANIQVLVIAGICGVIVKTMLNPQHSWKYRVAQGIVGSVTAIFIGPILAGILTGFVDKEVYAWLAAGFICGYGGESIVEIIQKKVFVAKK